MTERKASRADEELKGLANARFSTGSWPSESEIRSHSTNRHRRRMRATGLAAMALVIVVITSYVLVGPGSSRDTPSNAGMQATTHIGSAVELTSLVGRPSVLNQTAEAKVADAEEEFSLKILGKLVSEPSGANQLLSPFSLAEALAMAQLGARGQTATQLAGALGLSDVSASDQALGWATLDEDLPAAATRDHIVLGDANSIWTQSGFPIEPNFLKDLKTEFGAGVWQANFANDPASAVRSVNAWVSQKTDGQIPVLLQPSDTPPSTAAVLLNAVLFEAQWVTQLTDTTSGVFHAPSGDVPVTYMSPPGNDDQFLSAVNSNLTAVQIPYWKGAGQQGSRPPGRYAALLLMPTSGSLEQLVGGLDSSDLDRIIGGMTSQYADLEVPEANIGSSLELAPALEALGVKDAFECRLLGVELHRDPDKRGQAAGHAENHQMGNGRSSCNCGGNSTDPRQGHS
jgi:serine protease inhibitor